MRNLNFTKGMNGLPNHILLDINVAHTFGTGSFRPVNGALVIIVETSCGRGLKKTQIGQYVAKPQDGFRAGVSGLNFSFAGAATSSLFLVTRPEDRRSTKEEDMTAD